MKMLILSAILMFAYPGKRQILLFYNNDGVALKEKQLSLLDSDKKGLQERDIVIHTYQTEAGNKLADQWRIKSNQAFTFILVGKDGGEKMRSDSIVSLAQLYKTIDAMPMRRDEMKRNK